MVSSGGSEVGAAKLTGEIMSIVSRVPDVVKSMTGVDISKVKTKTNFLRYQTNQQLYQIKLTKKLYFIFMFQSIQAAY
mgnify:CR=1 FL=1